MSLEETLENIRSSPTPSNEQAAKFSAILPVLRAVGWTDTNWNQVRFEHPVGPKAGGRVDIALVGPQHEVALIEAKAPGQDLNKHVDQVIRYAFFQGADICVLTTGLEWWFYLPREKGLPEQRKFLTLRIMDDRVEQLAEDIRTFLGRENLIDGRAGRKAKQVLEARHLAARMNIELPKVWLAMLQEPDPALVELVRKRAYEKLDHRPDNRQVAAVLTGHRVPIVTDPPPRPPRQPDKAHPPKPPAETPITKTRKTRTKPTRIRLWGNHYEVKTWKGLIIQVAECIHHQHGASFSRILELRGKRKPYASRTPDGMIRPEQIEGSGIYIETNLSGKQVIQRANLFLEHFNHSPSDLEILYD